MNNSDKNKKLTPMNIKRTLHETEDASIFKKNARNREVSLDSSKRKSLEKSILDCGILSNIIVDTNLQILDGQHRIAICLNNSDKKINIPYIKLHLDSTTPEGDELAAIITRQINSETTPWQIHDFINNIGGINPTYLKLQELHNKYKFNYPFISGILTCNLNNSTTRTTALKNGLLEVDDRNFDITEDFLGFFQEFSKFSKRPIASHSAYALFKIWTLQAVDLARLLKLAPKIIDNWKKVPSNRGASEKVIFDTYNNRISKGKSLEYIQVKGLSTYKILGKNGKSRYPELGTYDFYTYEID